MIPLLIALASAGECDVPTPCATGHAFAIDHDALRDPDCAALLPARRAPDPWPAPRRDLGKTTRDSFGDFPNTVETDNFIVKWGVNDRNVDRARVTQLMDALEDSWAIYIDDWGYTAPAGSDSYKFNVYIGSTGSGTPDDLGAGGYYWTDDNGFPMVVVSQGGLADNSFVGTLAAHEFFHAIQDANGAFEYDDVSGWFWEATAMWVENQVFPDSAGWAVFLHFFAIRPELHVAYFDYPDTGITEEYYQYGAFVYIEHLTENHGGPLLIQQAFERSQQGGTPMEVLDDLVTETGGDIRASFGDFSHRNATWDYDAEDDFEAAIDIYGGIWVDGSHHTAGTVSQQTDGWVSPERWAPSSFGTNYWELRRVPQSFELDFEGDDEVTWSVGIASQTGTTHDDQRMRVDGASGRMTVDGLDSADEAWIVVSAAGSLRDEGGPYDYQIRVTSLVDAPDDPEDPDVKRGCSCTSGPEGPLLWLPVLLIPLLRLRRR